MPAQPRKTAAPAKPATKAAPAKPANAPVSPASGFDLAALAAGAKDAALPKVTRGGREGGKTKALADLVTTSFTDNKAKQLPPVPGGAEAAKSLTSAVRRAATMAGLGVSVRYVIDDKGMVTITLLGKEKTER